MSWHGGCYVQLMNGNSNEGHPLPLSRGFLHLHSYAIDNNCLLATLLAPLVFWISSTSPFFSGL